MHKNYIRVDTKTENIRKFVKKLYVQAVQFPKGFHTSFLKVFKLYYLYKEEIRFMTSFSVLPTKKTEQNTDISKMDRLSRYIEGGAGRNEAYS